MSGVFGIETIDVIQMDHYANPPTEFADVVIPAAISGIEAEGSVYRMDNIPLRLRKLVEAEYMADEEIMKGILGEVKGIKRKRRRLKGSMAEKTVFELNERIKDGSVRVVTADKMSEIVKELGLEEATREVNE